MALKTQPSPKQEEQFPFEKKNYIFLLIGIGILILGFALMAGGGSPNPNVFSMDIFSHRRITVAPITVLLGFGMIGYAIMHKPKKNDGGSKTEEPYKKS